MASAEPQDGEPIATPNSMGGLYEAMKLLHARTDNRVERALAAQSDRAAGNKEQLLGETQNAERKIFIRSKGTLTMHEFQALLTCSLATTLPHPQRQRHQLTL